VKVFICGIIQGSHSGLAVHEQTYRQHISEIVEKHIPGARIYCPVSLHPESVSYDDATAFRVLEESIEEARQADILIAYLPEASMGSAIEMWEAKRKGVRIIAITPMKHNWVVRYAADAIVEDLSEFEGLLSGQALDWLSQ
jgi:hypothetical protein